MWYIVWYIPLKFNGLPLKKSGWKTSFFPSGIRTFNRGELLNFRVERIPRWFSKCHLKLDWYFLRRSNVLLVFHVLLERRYWWYDFPQIFRSTPIVAHARTTHWHDTPENATKPTSPGREHKAQNSWRPNGTFSNHGLLEMCFSLFAPSKWICGRNTSCCRSSIGKPERLLGVKTVHLLVSRLGVTCLSCLVLPSSGQL